MEIYQFFIFLIISVIGESVCGAEKSNDCIPVNEQNLIRNGGFEQTALNPNEIFRVTNEIPGWTIGGSGTLYDDGDVHSGTQMLELATTHGYKIAQTVKTRPGQKYLLRFWSKFRKLEYNELNVFLENYPNRACGTESKFTLLMQDNWQEYGYILCPDAHQMTIEFGQQRETGGGYGIHLDTVSLVPCTEGRPTSETLAFLGETWVHSHEEGDDSIVVWRRSGSRQFAPSRFRRTLSFYSNGQCQFLSLEPNDTHHRKACSWGFDPASNKLVIRESTGQIAGNYRLNSLTKDLLMISR